MVVAQRVHPDTGEQIEVSLVVSVDYVRSASPVDQNVVTVVGSEQVLPFQFLYVFERHWSGENPWSPLLTEIAGLRMVQMPCANSKF